MRNTVRKSFALLLVICMVLGMMPFAAFASTTVSVSTLSELKSAVVSASDGAVIDVTADIQLTEAINVSSKVTLTSSSGHSVLRSSSYSSYMFVVADGGELTLENITVNGNRTSYQTADLATEMIVVQSGAVLNFNEGTLLTTNRGNAAVSGGGITVVGTLNMNGGTIANIHMHNSSSVKVQYGAAITVAGGTVNMYGGMIGASDIGSDSQNDGRNGAVGVVSGTFNMYGGSISGNVANEQGGGAGGVHISAGGTFNLDGGTVSNNNSRRNGGGFYNEGTLNIISGTVSGNTATYTDKNDDPTIFYGGAIYNVGTVTVSGGEIKDNIAKSCGGAVYSTGTMTVTGGTFSGNISQRYSAGALFIDGTGTLRITGGTFTGNTAGQFGGAMAVTSSATNALVITGGVFSSNNCGSSQGGADIYITTSGTSNVVTSYIDNCVTYKLYLDNAGSRYSASNAVQATSSALTANNGYVYVASGAGHVFGDWVTVTEATCTTAGSAKRTCQNCGYEESKTLTALGHSWDSGKITTAATCTTSGIKTYTCTRCSATKTETIAALGHTRGAATTIQPTCTETGSTTYKCTVCGLAISEEIPALGHSGVVTRVEATCTTAGSITNKCSRCGYILSSSILPATGHKESDWIVKIPATKTSTGLRVIECTVCGEVLNSEIIDMIPDPTVEVGTVEADIGAKAVKVPVSFVGNEGVYSMGFYIAYDKSLTLNGVLTGDTFTTIIDSPLNVDPAQNARAAAAFAAAGVSTSGVYCYRYYSENIAIENITNDGTICTFVFDLPEDSEYEYSIVIVPIDGMVINENGDEVSLIYKNGSIIVPDADTCEHIPGEWTITVEPTCTKSGEKTRYCVNCGKFYDKAEVAPLGHDYSDYVTTISATCTGTGQKTSTCSRCGATRTLPIEPTGHIPGEWVTEVEAVGSQDGLATKRCTVCGALLDSKIIPAPEKFQIVVSSATAVAGSTVDVTISIINNPGIYSLMLSCYYDESLTVTNAKSGDVFTEEETIFTVDVYPDGRASILDAMEYTGVSTEGKKVTKLLWDYTDDCNNTSDGVLATYTISIPEDAVGTYTIGLACYVPDDILNFDIESLDTVQFVNGEITIVDFVCDHEWSEWSVTTPVTCTENGAMSRTCSICGKTETKTVYAEGHKFSDAVIAKAPTCTESGESTRTCSVCDFIEKDEIAALGHDYGDPVTVDATCTAAGSVVSICSRCGSKLEQVIPAKGHTPGAWVIISETEKARYCTVCDTLLETADTTDKTPSLVISNKVVTVGEKATVTLTMNNNPGFFAGLWLICYTDDMSLDNITISDTFASVSEESIVDVYVANNKGVSDLFDELGIDKDGIKAVGVFLVADDVDVMCTESGLVATLTFSGLDKAGVHDIFFVYDPESITDNEFNNVEFNYVNGSVTVENAPACTHEKTTVKRGEPTCTNAGVENIVCTVCGEIISSTILPALGHSWDAGVETLAPTCTEKGIMTYKCIVCNETKTEEILANGHTFSEEWTTDVEPTETTSGSESRHCLYCDATTDIQEIDPLGTEVLLGDVNGDGRVNSIDLLIMKRYISGRISSKSINKTNADINNDGRVNSVDFRHLSAYLSQKSTYADLEAIHNKK